MLSVVDYMHQKLRYCFKMQISGQPQISLFSTLGMRSESLLIFMKQSGEEYSDCPLSEVE